MGMILKVPCSLGNCQIAVRCWRQEGRACPLEPIIAQNSLHLSTDSKLLKKYHCLIFCLKRVSTFFVENLEYIEDTHSKSKGNKRREKEGSEKSPKSPFARDSHY